VARKGLATRNKGAKAMLGSMESMLIGERYRLDRGLVILGTLGNNAPFIGLFGTVLGIIIAFHDLARNPEGGPAVVMSGISEALVATAVGLIVAIPAVIFFNLFTRIVKRHIANTESIIKLIMTFEADNPPNVKEA
jgi:biopolymer transport protein ExbB